MVLNALSQPSRGLLRSLEHHDIHGLTLKVMASVCHMSSSSSENTVQHSLQDPVLLICIERWYWQLKKNA